MTDPTRSVIDLVTILMNAGLSPETSLRVSREIDVTFGLSTRSSGSSVDQREKWRLKKERQRARQRSASPGDRGDKTQNALIEEIPFTDLSSQKKNSKSETSVSPASPGTKPKREKRATGDVLPDDWAPTDKHYELGAALNFDRKYVDDLADRMRNWAVSNAHRQVARKAGVKGWNAAFSNWMKSHHEKVGGSNATTRNGAPNGGGSGHTLAARLRQSVGDRAGGHAGRVEPDDRR